MNQANRMRLFLDTEFTGLHQESTLISLGIVSETGISFYAEFTDYDPDQFNEWLEANVLKHLTLNFYGQEYVNVDGDGCVWVRGNSEHIKAQLTVFLKQFQEVEFWLDYAAYDWVLFCELFGGSMYLPENVYYIPFDLMTLLKMHGVDPDVSRQEFVKDIYTGSVKHHALEDAKLIYYSFVKLTQSLPKT